MPTPVFAKIDFRWSCAVWGERYSVVAISRVSMPCSTSWASSRDVEGVTGTFFELGQEVPCQFRDEAVEERLWQTCEQLVRQLEPKP